MYNTRVVNRFDFTGSFTIFFLYSDVYTKSIFHNKGTLYFEYLFVLFGYWFAPSWKIFHSYGQIKIAGDGLQISSFALRL